MVILTERPSCGVAYRFKFVDHLLAVHVAGVRVGLGRFTVVSTKDIDGGIITRLFAIVDVFELVVVDNFIARVI